MNEERKAVLVISLRFHALAPAPKRAGCENAAAVANLCGEAPGEENFALRKLAAPDKRAVDGPASRGALNEWPAIRGALKECPPIAPMRGAACAAGAARPGARAGPA